MSKAKVLKVIVFEQSGKILLATAIDPTKEICRKNLTDFQECPSKILNYVPNGIADFCMKMAPYYLYFNSYGTWEATSENEITL